MIFKSVKIEDYCPTITTHFKIAHLRNTHLVETLIVSFKGQYRLGSSGSPDAGFIKGFVKTGVEVFDPFELVVDLTDLEYQWGDDIDLTFGGLFIQKIVVVVGEKCRKALSTLLLGLDSDNDIVDNDYYFDNMEEALLKLKAGK